MFGVYAPGQTDIAGLIYYGLYSLQHRGQESCGIVVNDDGVFVSYKDLGLVNEVFGKDVLRRLPTGRLGVGHVRYGTTGGTDRANCQPIEINHSKGRLALAHNGNISNAYDLRCALESRGAIFHTTSDTETIAYIVTQERLCTPSIQEAVSRAMYQAGRRLLHGADVRRQAHRRPRPARLPPAVLRRHAGRNLHRRLRILRAGAVGARFERDVLPGEILVFDENGVHSDTSHCAPHATCGKHTCVFEYIYFARPDSVIDGVSVHAARQRAGQVLGTAPSRRGGRRHRRAGLRAGCGTGLRGGIRHPLRHRIRQEPLHRAHLHLAGAGSAHQSCAHQALAGDRGGRGQARRAGG